MSLPSQVFGSSPQSNSSQLLLKAKLVPDKPHGQIHTRLPRMWVGIVLAMLCFLFQFLRG
jgi:hypothetical protein